MVVRLSEKNGEENAVLESAIGEASLRREA